jgi:hypothetical protein
MSDYEQLTLDLEYPVYDHYTVELRKGEVGNMAVLRSHNVRSTDDATNLIDGLRDSALQRDKVTWQHDEVQPNGTLYGMTDEGTLYMISVVPPLSESLLVS